MAYLLVGMCVLLLLIAALGVLAGKRREFDAEPVERGVGLPAEQPGRGPVSLNAYWMPPEPSRRHGPTRTGTTRRRHDEPEYRVGESTSASEERWNPFDPSIERKHRLRAARRRPDVAFRRRDDYYTLLGLEPGATDRQIELAYRSRVAENHPDRFFDDPHKRRVAEERLKELNRAMQVLRDPIRRAKYDATR